VKRDRTLAPGSWVQSTIVSKARDPGPPPPRPLDAHKASVGRVLVVGGSRDMSGAPFLAAYGALRAGAGLARAAVPREIQPTVAGFAPEVLTAGLASTRSGGLARGARPAVRALAAACDAVVLGPGAGREAATLGLLLELAGTLSVPLVMDADALFALAGRRSAWRALKRRKPATVLTPHEGEAARLLDGPVAEVRADRPKAARTLARESGATVVLKGPHTLVCQGAWLWQCPAGGPVLATGGTGDVLAGMTAALLAAGPDDPFTAACRAVAWHARAADALARRLRTDRGVLARELADALPGTLRGGRGPA